MSTDMLLGEVVRYAFLGEACPIRRSRSNTLESEDLEKNWRKF